MSISFKMERDACDCWVKQGGNPVAWIQSTDEQSLDCYMGTAPDNHGPTFTLEELEAIIKKMKELKKKWKIKTE